MGSHLAGSKGKISGTHAGASVGQATDDMIRLSSSRGDGRQHTDHQGQCQKTNQKNCELGHGASYTKMAVQRNSSQVKRSGQARSGGRD
jgi:hypothetical protein